MRHLLIISFCFFFIQLTGQTLNSGEYIAVIGKASASYAPDMVSFDFSIDAKEKKQSDAIKKLNEQSEKVISIIAALGYNTKELKLSSYNLGEDIDYSGDKSKNIGYRAYISLELEIKYSEESFNVLIDSITSSKIPDLEFTYTSSFSDELQEKIRKELLGKASDDAESIAETLAQSRNVKLGDIFSIEYTDNNFSLYGQGILPPPPPPMEVDYAVSPQKISANISMQGIYNHQEVRIIYKIKK